MSTTAAVRGILKSARDAARTGDVRRATAIYREVLARDPRQPEALHALARFALRAGRDTEALPLLRAALEIAPAAPSLLADQAVALQNLGRNDEAAEAARNALAIQPSNLSALNTLGNALRALGSAGEAVQCFRRAVEAGPDVALVHLNLSGALHDSGRTEEALAAAERAAALAPDVVDAHLLMATLHRTLGSPAEALDCLTRTLELEPDHPQAHHLLGNLLLDLGEREAAESSYRRALELRPGLVEARVRLAQVSVELGRHVEALAHFGHVATQRPDLAEAHVGMGNALRELGGTAEAEAAYRRGLAVQPDLAAGWCNLATLYLDLGRLDDAEDAGRRAIALEPGLAEAHWNLAQAFLTRGELLEGWRRYEYRLLKRDAAELAFPIPLWDGVPLAGRTLFVTAEQGVGDEILFASCLPDVRTAAPHSIVECDARLVSLFERSFPGLRCIVRLQSPHEWPQGVPRPDVRIATGSLPRFFRPDVASFPERRAYLTPDPERVALWRERFASLGSGLKVGISWRGGKEARVRRERSISLPAWAGLDPSHGMHFVNLQYGDCAAELGAARAETGLIVHHWADADPLVDLDGLAAQIAALDLVLSVDNATVHLAGAVGAPTWVLLPFVADWRWMSDRDDSPWYPALRLFRQRRSGDWGPVLEDVRRALERRVSSAERTETGPRERPRGPRAARESVAFVNDTTYWYHWGCTGTSIAIVRELTRRGYAVHRVPISGLYGLCGGPESLDDFDDAAVFRRFMQASPWLGRELGPADHVVVNGEGSLHGLNEYVLNLLYLAYAAKTHLGKRVQIINHSCYPEDALEVTDSAVWRLYRKTYGALDHVVIREPVSHALLARAGIDATLGGDCLPLYVADHTVRTAPRREGVVVAGSVAAGAEDVAAYAAFIAAMLEQGVPVTILTGANLLPAVDEERFARALLDRVPGAVRLVDADSITRWLDTVAGARVVVSGRFHHTVAAAALGTPFVLVGSNTPKNSGLAQMLGAPAPLTLGSPGLAERLIAGACDKLESPPEQGEAGQGQLAALCEAALRNFEKLPALATSRMQ